MKNELLTKFAEIFGDLDGTEVYFAPGRVNLIGEHIDYSGGHVFPCALNIGTYAVARLRSDNKIYMYSTNFSDDGVQESSLEKLEEKEKGDWKNYPKGVIWSFIHKGFCIDKGMDILFCGNIPNGSGLSSSASIEVLTGFVLSDLFKINISNQELALIGQFSENTYNGVNCGIMDQFAVAMGKKEAAIFLDTSSLVYEYAPLRLGDIKIVIMNTNKKRGLGDSKYNERRKECEMALNELKVHLDIESLCELTEQEFEKNKHLIHDEIRIKRARHAVSENQRTIKAVEALKVNDIELLGKLMIESHESLRNDYEVTGVELDTIVAEALKQDGVIGARMTGAGFGGCAVGLVHSSQVDIFMEKVSKAYKERIGYEPHFHIVEIGDGPSKI